MYIISRLINAILYLLYSPYEPILMDGICHPLLFIIISTIFLLICHFFVFLKRLIEEKVETVAL